MMQLSQTKPRKERERDERERERRGSAAQSDQVRGLETRSK